MIMTSVARPYAKAVFDIAVQDHRLEPWSSALTIAALIVQDKQLHQLLCDPRVDNNEVLSIFFDLLKKDIDEKVKTFLQLLMAYERIALLPSILVEYQRLLAKHTNTVDAVVSSAMALTQAQQAQLKTALSKRFSANVNLHCEVDKELLAGAVIRVGDTVIDGSVRGRVEKFKEELVVS